MLKKPAQEKIKFSEKKSVHVYASTPYSTSGDKKWNIVCLPLLGFSLVGLGLTLIIIGAVKDIEDLVLLGCIFSVGSTVFFVLMYTAVCRPVCQRNIVQTFDLVDTKKEVRPNSNKPTGTVDTEYYNTAFDHDEDLIREKSRQKPSENQLYGEKMRSFLATPATTTDVTFYTDDPGTPPPPRLALPSDPGDKKNAVFTMDVTKEMTKDISQLELL